MSDEVAARIAVYPEDELPCPVAHYIAADLGIDPLEVGQAADALGKRVSMCQLGLFGYARKGRLAYRVRTPMADVPDDLAAAIRAASTDGRVPCAALWEIGRRFDLSRLEMGNAAEGLGIKVKPCQLGFF